MKIRDFLERKKTTLSNHSAFIFLRHLLHDIKTSDLVNHAYAMAYVTLFSLVPSLAATFGVLYLFAPLFGKNTEIIDQVKNFILKHLATGSGEEVIQQIDVFLQNTDFAQIGASGFAGMVFTLVLLLRHIELALNRIFEVEDSRPMLTRFIYFWTVLTLGTFLFALALGILAGSHFTEQYLTTSLSLKIIREFVYNLSIVGLFVFVYRVIPNRTIPWKDALIGGLFAALCFAQSLRFFSIYISYFTKFTAIYGALSAVPIFLFWLYVVWFITLLGAVITKRSMEGFSANLKLSDEVLFSRVLAPLWAFYSICKNFEEGNGRGLSEDEIRKDLGLSKVETSYAIRILEKHSLVISHQVTDSSDRAPKFFPATPTDKTNFAKLHSLILGESSSWMPPTSRSLSTESKFLDMAQELINKSPTRFSSFFEKERNT